MKKVLNRINWEAVFLLVIVLISSITMVYNIKVNKKLTNENTQLKEEISALKVENEEQMDTIIDRNQEIYRLEMLSNEWKELFYAQIEFYPDESYPYK